VYLAKVKVATKAKTLAKIDQCYEAQLRESKNTPFYAWPAIIWAKSDFQYSSTVGINNKFVIRLLLYFLPHFKCVYTSPCKMQKINMQHVRGLSAVNDGDEKK